ncbi:MAG: FHA domain-containing protein [Bryobacteraceae bacterium]|nr:FHA domain-containing protein [Bryobacteraceae bacterium]
MNLFRDLERRIDQQLRRLFQSEPVPGQGRELIEIQKAILEKIEERIQMLPRARRSFPFHEVAVRIPADTEDRRMAIEAVFIADGALQNEITEHLRRDNVEFPSDLAVNVTIVDSGELTEPSVICKTRQTEAEKPAAVRKQGTLRFTLPDGSVVEASRARVEIGRTADVLDDRLRLVRRNDLVLEADTVSRAHAHVEWIDGEYRLFDDGSSYGTSAIHNGRLIEVPRAGGRGLRIDSGDELYFGQVRLQLEILTS